MADLAVNATRVRILESIDSRHRTFIADEDISRGQAIYVKLNGRAGLARGNAVGTSSVRGIATQNVKAGSAFEAIYHGYLAGFDLSALNYGVTVYLSAATAGAVADTRPATSGQVAVPLASVHAMSDVASTKILFVDIPQAGDYVAIA